MFKLHSFLAPVLAVTVVACGARFSPHEHNGAPGGAGEASGGFTSSAGSSSVGNGGEPETGGSGAAGSSSTGTGGTVAIATGGAPTATGGAATATGGAATATAGSGGRGWWTGNGGGSSLSQCATLRQEYQASIEKARVCDKGSTDQCSPTSAAPIISGCGCATLINTKSAAGDAVRKAYQAYLDAKCEPGPVCDIACPVVENASCAQSVGSGTFVCTGDGFQK
ncbi:MAG TPA: hypothetical protein VER96_12840 [Polyangiaceae bacterium]|nr:hypothetical protein [Polyangiaceae bacterium]